MISNYLTINFACATTQYDEHILSKKNQKLEFICETPFKNKGLPQPSNSSDVNTRLPVAHLRIHGICLYLDLYFMDLCVLNIIKLLIIYTYFIFFTLVAFVFLNINILHCLSDIHRQIQKKK